MEGKGRPDAAPNVKHDLADTAPHGVLGSHRIGPKAIELSLFKGLGGHHAERDARLVRARNPDDPYGIAFQIDPDSISIC